MITHTIVFLFRIAPALLRQASYGTLKIGLYHYIKRTFVPNPKGGWREREEKEGKVDCSFYSSLATDETILTNVVAGILSGAISSAVANPTDVLKVQGLSRHCSPTPLCAGGTG